MRPLLHPSHLLRLAEDARLGLDAFDAAGAGIAAALRAHTLDADGAQQLLHLINESMKTKLDTLVSELAKSDADGQQIVVRSDCYPARRAASDTTSAPSRSCTR